MPRRLRAALGGLLLTIIAPHGVAAEFRILRYEPLVVSEAVHPQSGSLRGAPVARESGQRGSALRFRAFATDFSLDLEPNDRINAALSPLQRESLVALRGSIVGKAGSWVRLVRDHGRLSGMLFDGRELYSVETAAMAKPFIRNPIGNMADDAAVIYRLSDTLTALDGDFCGVAMVPGVSTQGDAFKALAAQLQEFGTASLVATKQLEVGVIADYELTSAQGNGVQAAVVARMNIVDGIFSNQVGVHVAVRSITTFPEDNDPFTTTVPSDLLTALGNYRRDTPAQQSTGLTHLMTGRNLDGMTVGIAYSGSGNFYPLCTVRNSASLSEARPNISVTDSALIAAHEMGHVFGAPHDAEAGSACESTPATFLMAAQLNHSQDFSPCSLQQMTPAVNGASCLAVIAQADAALVVPASAGLALNQVTVVTFSVNSAGPGAVGDVQVTVALPPGIVASGAGAVGGTCQILASQISCAISSIPAGESREVQLSLTGLAEGTANASLTLTASNDSQGTNNSAQLSLITSPGADLAVSVALGATSIETAATTVATISVSNLSAVATTGTRLAATIPAGLVAVSVEANSLGCSVDASNLFACTPVTLAANSSQTVVLTLRGASAGTPRLNLSVTSQVGDPNAANNSAGVTVTVTAPVVVTPAPTPPAGGTSSGGSSGGGGQLGLELGALALALAAGVTRGRRNVRAAALH